MKETDLTVQVKAIDRVKEIDPTDLATDLQVTGLIGLEKAIDRVKAIDPTGLETDLQVTAPTVRERVIDRIDPVISIVPTAQSDHCHRLPPGRHGTDLLGIAHRPIVHHGILGTAPAMQQVTGGEPPRLSFWEPGCRTAGPIRSTTTMDPVAPSTTKAIP